jgi:hypothetical protein
MKNIDNHSYNTPDQFSQRIALLENQMRILNNTLAAFFVKGRLRTDRTAPTSSADVQTPDKLYDRVVKNDYEYILIDNAGTLEWRRLTASTF